MKSTKTHTVEITLVMSDEESAWLHSAMQNPLHGQHQNDESQGDSAMRKLFWEATKPSPF